MDARNPNAVALGSLEPFSTQIPVHVSKSVTAGMGTQKYKVWVYELSLQPTPTEVQEPPTEAVSSSSSNDQELQKEKVSSTASTTDNKSTTESEGSQFPQGNRY